MGGGTASRCAVLDTEPAFPGGEVEEAGVGGGLPCEEGTDGDEDKGGDPHADGFESAFANGFFANHADDVVEDEEDDRGDKGHAEAAFADDGTEGGADEEEEETGDGEGEFAHELDVVAVDVLAVGVDIR